MSAFRKLLHSDTPTNKGGTGQIGGQGTHFQSGKMDTPTDPSSYPTAAENLGSTSSGVEGERTGYVDAAAAGPEVGGEKHVNTTAATEARSYEHPVQDQTATPSSTFPTQTQPSAVTSSSQHPSTGQQFPSTGGSGEAGGVAAIGQTTTYSSTGLAKGDPTGSVVHRDANPMTYKKVEGTPTSHSAGDVGVTSGAAASAASAAFAKTTTRERMPGEFPTEGYENPYKTSRLDPRVDGGRAGTAAAAETATKSSSYGRDATLGTGAAVGTGAAAIGASEAFASHQKSSDTSHAATGPPPSTLATTADPVDRSAEYQDTYQHKGLGGGSATTTTDKSTEGEQKSGMMGKVLGAIGLGGAAGGTAAAIGLSKKDDEKAVDTSSPAQETGPPKHYRRESIPTTAYPAGKLDAPQATAPPIGGSDTAGTHLDERDEKPNQSTSTGSGLAAAGIGAGAATGVAGGALAAHERDQPRELRESATSPNTTTRDTAAGVGAGTAAGVAGGAVAAHEIEKSRGLGDSAADQTSRSVPQSAEIGHGTTSVPQDQYSQNQGLRETKATQGTTVHDQTTILPTDTEATKDESHLGRNTAIGAGSAAAAGGAAYAAHEYQEKKGSSSGAALPDRTRDTTATTSKDGPPVDAVAAAPGRLDGQDYRQQTPKDEDHTARNTALGAGAGAVAVGGTAAAIHEADKDKEEKLKSTPSNTPSKDKEKKPSVFKRIFKRRKNKDTGEEEDYSTDEEDNSSGSNVPHHHSESKGRNVLGSGKTYEELSGGSLKPSYNPFRHDKPLVTGEVSDRTTETSVGNNKPRDSLTGLPYDPSKDPAAAKRLSHEPGATEIGQNNRGLEGAPSGGLPPDQEVLLDHEKPHDKRTGLAYDPRRDPEAARRLSQEPGANPVGQFNRGTDGAPSGGAAFAGEAIPEEQKPHDKVTGLPHA